ncbi:MAG: CDP-alcohol phosphatidyltransferase family protein [Phycisphaerae bacterium]|jgi:CDP-diacylglycerol--serine O-phosphatidyltransferase
MFLRLGPKTRSVPLAALVPNMLTTLAVCCGLASVHFALLKRWELALAAIVLAAIFDVLDGGAARLLRVQSPFGAVLDSLSDFLAFGIAPAVIMHQWLLNAPSTKTQDALELVSVMVFALCAALRLARFTAQAHTQDIRAAAEAWAGGPTPAQQSKRPSMFFSGMPTPAGAGVALIPAMLAASDDVKYFGWNIPGWVVALHLLITGLLMVSTMPMFAIKGIRISRNLVVPLLIGVVTLATLTLVSPWLTIASLAGLYVLSIPVAIVVRARQRANSAPAATM